LRKEDVEGKKAFLCTIKMFGNEEVEEEVFE
jgi:hypothetical protein